MSEVTSVNGMTGAVVLTAADVEAVPTSAEGQPSGVATLDGSGVLKEAQLSGSVVSGSAGASPAQIVPVAMAITKEAPVNPLHPSFGALGNESHDDTAALQAAITYARTAGQKGGVGELYIPGGVYKLSAFLNLGTVSGLKIRGDGEETVLKQFTNNEPILQREGSEGVYDGLVSGLKLNYASQQNQTEHPKSVAVSLLNSMTGGTGGFAEHVFRDLWINYATTCFEWGPTGSATAVPFWNNKLDNIICGNISLHLLNNNIVSGSVGGPTNEISRLTHIGRTIAPTGVALNLRAGHEWVFNSLDIEDWQDSLLYATGTSQVVINGMHVERHHLVSNAAKVFNVSGSQFTLKGLNGSYYRDGTGPYYLFAMESSRGEIGNFHSFDYSEHLGSGILRHFLFNGSGGAFQIGPRESSSGNIVDWLKEESAMLVQLYSDCGLPPVWDSSVALPTASATYRGRFFYLKGTNTTTADHLVVCRQNEKNEYAWVNVF
jgi:hypothetical protein